jgi:hypothetical protein
MASLGTRSDFGTPVELSGPDPEPLCAVEREGSTTMDR